MCFLPWLFLIQMASIIEKLIRKLPQGSKHFDIGPLGELLQSVPVLNPLDDLDLSTVVIYLNQQTMLL